MASGITLKGKKVGKGKRMMKGRGWKLVKGKGRNTVFEGTLLSSFNLGDIRVAIFSVPK